MVLTLFGETEAQDDEGEEGHESGKRGSNAIQCITVLVMSSHEPRGQNRSRDSVVC